MSKKTSVFWFRRDLRLEDNAGLYHALKENEQVLPIFIFDTHILQQLEDPYDRRVDFIQQALRHLNDLLLPYGSSLTILHTSPEEAFKELMKDYPITAVYTNHDYEPVARARDTAIGQLLKTHAIPFKTYKDQCVFEKDEVLKDDGKPYTVFTPYSNKWKKNSLLFTIALTL